MLKSESKSMAEAEVIIKAKLVVIDFMFELLVKFEFYFPNFSLYNFSNFKLRSSTAYRSYFYQRSLLKYLKHVSPIHFL